MTSHGFFMWNELITGDVAKAKAFYETTIGWKIEKMGSEYGDYWMATADGKPVAGMMDMRMVPAGTPPHWFAYLAVDDVDRRVKEAAAAGAKIVREPFEIPNVGRIAILADPTGAMVGWMTPKQ